MQPKTAENNLWSKRHNKHPEFVPYWGTMAMVVQNYYGVIIARGYGVGIWRKTKSGQFCKFILQFGALSINNETKALVHIAERIYVDIIDKRNT